MLDGGPDHDEVKLVGVAGIREKHVERGEVEGIAAAGGSIDSDHDPSGRHVICFSVICLRSRFVGVYGQNASALAFSIRAEFQ